MSQDVILKKFANYIDLIEPQLVSELKAEIEKLKLKKSSDSQGAINYLKKQIKTLPDELDKLYAALDEGHCFSFSTIHAAMDAVGKLQWWEEALVAIAKWDETPESLEQEVALSDADADAYWQKKDKEKNTSVNKKKIKLKTLFERVLSYLVSNQGAYDAGFKIKGLNQRNLLSPKNYFEILDKDGIKRVEKKKVAAGYFTRDQLMKFLKEENFDKTISLIHSSSHTIRVYFKEGKWIVYDSNYSHESLDTLHKEFTNKEELVEEIFSILGQSIAIEIAACHPSRQINFSDFYLLESEEVGDRIKELGLHMIAFQAPAFLPQTLRAVSQLSKGPELVAQALLEQNDDGWTGLHMVAYYAPEALSQTLALASKAENGPELVAQALAARNKNGWAGLHIIAHHAPDSLLQALMLAAKAEKGHELIAKALVTQDEEKEWTGLQMIARYAPEALSQTLTLASKAENGSLCIARALAAQNEDGWTGLHIIAHHAPKVLWQALTLAAKTERGPALIAKALAAKNAVVEWNGLQMIACYAPKTLSQALILASKAENGPELVAKALAAQNESGWTGLRMIAYYAPEVLSQVLRLASKAENGSKLIIKALTAQKKWNGLQVIADHAPDALSLFLPQDKSKPKSSHNRYVLFPSQPETPDVNSKKSNITQQQAPLSPVPLRRS